MRKIKSSIIFDKINTIKKSNPSEFKTNYFFNQLDEEILCLDNDNAIIFLQPEYDFFRLYFAYVDTESLDCLFDCLKNNDIYLEIITKTKPNEELNKIILKHFSFETLYQKMFKKLKITEEKTSINDLINVDEIYEKIFSTFNIHYDHFMSKEELKELADSKQILTIYENNELKSFLIFKTKGSSAYLNHIANYGSKQNLIALWEKFYQVLNNNRINYLDLWYDTANKKAFNMYNIENFKNFPLKNYIYKLNR